MKTFIPCFLILLWMLSTGCLKQDTGCPYKDNSVVAPSSEEQMVLNYLNSNNITAIKHGSNMYYQTITAGTGGSPNICSGVVITYTGKLLNGTVFDQGSDKMFVLGSLIEGMKKGIPLIQKGGTIRLFIPPTLGYGPNDIKDINNVVIIPANSVLIFDVTLVSF